MICGLTVVLVVCAVETMGDAQAGRRRTTKLTERGPKSSIAVLTRGWAGMAEAQEGSERVRTARARQQNKKERIGGWCLSGGEVVALQRLERTRVGGVVYGGWVKSGFRGTACRETGVGGYSSRRTGRRSGW